MFENETRLRELACRASDGAMSDDEFAELVALSKVKQKDREERAALIAGIRASLGIHGVAIHDLFTAAEIAAAAGGNPNRDQNMPGAAGAWFKTKVGAVLIQVSVPGASGFPVRYCKGQSQPGYVAKGLKMLDDGRLESNLERFYTDKGRQYFATDEGHAELARLVSYIKTHKIKLHMR